MKKSISSFILFFTVAVSFAVTKTWIGTTAGWTVATNWSPANAPLATDNVVINPLPAGKFSPSITAGTITIAGLTFGSGTGTNAKINLANAGVALRITGNYLNNSGNTSKFIGAGKVVMYRATTGTSTVSGSTEFNKLEINGATGATPTINLIGTAQTYGINTSLNVVKGTLAVGTQNLVLHSLCDGITGNDVTAYIDGAGNGSITGNVTINKCIFDNGIGTAYKGITCPIANCGTADLTDDITGTSFIPTYCYTNPVVATPSDWIKFNETSAEPGAGADFFYGWCGISSGTSIAPAEGTMIRFNATNVQNIDWTGVVNNGNITRVLQYTPANGEPANDGFNLVGNPYPSPINWQNYWDLYGSSSNLNPAIYVWVASSDYNAGGTGDYFAYDGSTQTGDFDGNISIGQAFWVKSTLNNNNFTLTNAVRTAGTPLTYLQKTNEVANYAKIEVSGNGNKDNVMLHFGDYESYYSDKQDLGKIMNSSNSIYALKSDNSKVKIGKYPYPVSTSVIPIQLKLKSAGEYTISASSFNIGDDYVAYWIDKKTNSKILLSSDTKFTFGTESEMVENRFSIQLMNKSYKTDNSLESNTVNTYTTTNKLNIQLSDNSNTFATVSLFDLLGKEVVRVNSSFENGKAELNTAEIASGVYFLYIAGGNTNYKQKITLVK